MRKQRVILKHHANLARFGGQMLARTADDLPCQPNGAGLDLFQPGYGAQQGGFTAA